MSLSSYKNEDLEGLVGQLLKDLKSPNQYVRENAANKFRIESKSSSNDTNIKQDKINIFNNLILGIAFDDILKGLEDHNFMVRISLIWCLGNLNDERCVKPLIKLLDDKDIGPREAAMKNLVILKDHSIQPLIKALNSKKTNIRRGVVVVLGEIGDFIAVDALTNSLKDPDWNVRFQSIEALGKIGDKRAIIPLSQCIRDKKADVRVKAVETLGKIDDKSAINKLNELSEHEDHQIRNNAKKALYEIGEINKEKIVPEWNTYNPNLQSATKEQTDFYFKFISELKKGNYLDVEGNLSYIFRYLYLILEEFLRERDIKSAWDVFDKIEDAYGEYKPIKNYLTIWKADMFDIIEDHKKALDIRRTVGLDIFDALRYTVLLNSNDFTFNGTDLIYLERSHLTDWGKKYRTDISKIADNQLNKFNEEKGKNIFKYFLEEFNPNDITIKDFELLKSFFKNEEDFLIYKERHEMYFTPPDKGPELQIYLKSLGFKNAYIHSKYINTTEIITKHKICVPSIVVQALMNELRRILRESENILRERKGIAKVGEGWIGETELFYKIKKAFLKENVIQHGKPSWLKPQHLDVYFPKRNIGIEYQGDQHQKPIEYFGGEEGLQKRLELDERKEKLCKENNCTLIYVYPDYDFDNVKNQIKKKL